MKRKPNQDNYITCLLPPPALRREFARVADLLPNPVQRMREEDLHLTMNELQIPRSRNRADLLARLGAIDFPAFTVQITDIDAFNRIPRSAVQSHTLWLRPDGPSSWDIQELHKKIHLSLRPVGYPVGRMEIRPHVTCLKYDFATSAADVRRFMELGQGYDFSPWRVDEFYLTKKRTIADPLHPDNNDGRGSRLEIIGRFPLRRPGAE